MLSGTFPVPSDFGVGSQNREQSILVPGDAKVGYYYISVEHVMAPVCKGSSYRWFIAVPRDILPACLQLVIVGSSTLLLQLSQGPAGAAMKVLPTQGQCPFAGQ